MNVKIRQEYNGDLTIIIDLIGSAFRNVRESDHKEQLLVERLHGSEKFIPQLPLVAETDNGRIVGYILLTEVEIVSANRTATSLAVTPLAVMPEFQNRGIGGMLIV